MSAWMAAQWVILVLAAPAAWYFIRHGRQGRVQYAYSIVLIFGFIWALGQHSLNCVRLYRPEETAFRVSLYLCYVGMCALGPACVYLSWCYAGKYPLYRKRGLVAALFGTGGLFYIAILTNDMHHLYYTRLAVLGRTYGALFYLFTGFSYACFAYAYAIMQRVRWDGENRTTLMFLLCFASPVAANTVGMILGDPALDFTPLAYAVMVAGALVMLWRHRMLNLTPVAAKSVFDYMSYPVSIVSPEGVHIYQNGVEEEKGHTYRSISTALDDGNMLVMRADTTRRDGTREALNIRRAELEAARARLDEQAAQLARQAQTAARLAADEQRMQITALLNDEVRGKLERMRAHTDEAIKHVDEARITEGQRLSTEALDLVRRIVREIKGRPFDGL